ncbi:MAG TPA: hypothetical protein PLO88_03065 [Bacilli bacterium]|nr:MAG: hypothetical protein BWY97_01397 [Tenericutes bacterium ADurb.BinA124]HPN61097.1 hypothetical protein [Bacilli bacterium]HPX84944.1 hypothetical protein [Bacilli bacterium]HQC75013.1 hypothetical protein [Bacilli bacterium]
MYSKEKGENMVALFIILNQEEYLEDVLRKLVHLGVGGATIIDSQGMGAAIVHNRIDSIPLFGSLKNLLAGSNPYNKTIMTVIKEEALLEKTMQAVNEIFVADKQRQAGFMFTVPVGHVETLGIK